MFQSIIKENLAKDKKAYAKMIKNGCAALAVIHEKKVKSAEEALKMIKNGVDEMEAYKFYMGLKK